MKWIHYSRYTGEDLGIGAEDLLQALSDFLLESGFNSQYMPFSEWNQHTLEDLKKRQQIGIDPLYDKADNPFPWMAEMIDLKKEKNFFETRVIEYQTGGALSWD